MLIECIATLLSYITYCMWICISTSSFNYLSQLYYTMLLQSLTASQLITKINTDIDAVNTYSKSKSHNYNLLIVHHPYRVKIRIAVAVISYSFSYEAGVLL